jgi:hypothetical protein
VSSLGRHRTPLTGVQIEVASDHAAALWLYETSGEFPEVDRRRDTTEPIRGFGGNTRRLSLIPFPLRNSPGTLVCVGGRSTRIVWQGAPERPPAKLEPQTEKEQEDYRLMLRATAVWDRLRDVETALGDPAQLWQELRRRWTEQGKSVAPRMDAIVQHAFILWQTIEELSRTPRRVLRRAHQFMPISRVQELDRRAMTWLVRQPGESLAERAGDQQRVLAVAREDNFDTLENRVLRAYCELAAHVARDYLELNRTKRLTIRARKVEAFGRSS